MSHHKLLAQQLGTKAKELLHGMRDRVKRDPDVADFASGFERVLQSSAEPCTSEFERGVLSRAPWTDALHATYFALFGKQPPETMKPCEISHAIVDYKLGYLCKAREAGTAGGNPPQDCDWPFCGCDPRAERVFEAIRESGMEVRRLSLVPDHLCGIRDEKIGAMCNLLRGHPEKGHVHKTERGGTILFQADEMGTCDRKSEPHAAGWYCENWKPSTEVKR